MYYELGPSPRPKYGIDFENGGPPSNASTWRDRARSCTSLTPVLFPFKTQMGCPHMIIKRGVQEPCGKRVSSRCTSCGCYGCIKPEGKLFKTHCRNFTRVSRISIPNLDEMLDSQTLCVYNQPTLL